MSAKVIIRGVMRPTVVLATLVALVVGLTGCARMSEPLGTEHLHDEAKDQRVSIVLLHFKTQQLSPVPKGFSEDMNRLYLRWIFAVANESTGWSFRKLDESSMIFRTRDASMEPDYYNVDAGWVTFLAPQGLSYITATTFATGLGHGGLDLIAKPFPDHISVEHSAARAKSGSWIMDFIDTPRFSLQVHEPRTLIYAGTIVRTIKCDKDESPSSTCPYDLTVVDESQIARAFVSRYQRNFPVTSPMQTQLLRIPLSRTIEIRSRKPPFALDNSLP